MTDITQIMAKAMYEAHALPSWQAGWEHEDPKVCEDYTKTARACLTALSEAKLVIVPLEPTEAMLKAGSGWCGHDEPSRADAHECWRDMVAAGRGET